VFHIFLFHFYFIPSPSQKPLWWGSGGEKKKKQKLKKRNPKKKKKKRVPCSFPFFIGPFFPPSFQKQIIVY